MARVAWSELPAEVRDWAERALGSTVVSADSMAGGFSPGAACRLRLANGEAAFLKAVSAAANPDSPGMWPSACVGAAVFDVAAFAPSVELTGGPPPESLLAWYGIDVPRDALAATVAGIAGYFTYRARLPAPPGLPTLRAFQEAQGIPARAWLQRLTGWS